MTKLSIFASALLLTANAFAHLEIGHYQGFTTTGEKCVLTVEEVSFAGGVKHPLNERVLVKSSFSESSLVLVHLPKIDAMNVTVRAEKDLLTGAIGLPTGAESLVLKMVHSSEFDGPTEFTFIREDKTNIAQSLVIKCDGLKFQE